jgi:Uma2 family endonuclease
MSTAALNRYTPEEYLAIDRMAEFKSEYIDGEIVAMTGGSRPHNIIVWNLSAMLRSCFEGRPCEAYSNDMRVKIRPSTRYVYPDLVAVCGEPRFEDAEIDVLLNPSLVVEVLSRSTQAYDRGDKAAHYRKIDSLEEYLLIAQDRVRIEQYTRRGDVWNLTEITDAGATLALASVGCEVPVREIYARLDVSAASEAAPSPPAGNS